MSILSIFKSKKKKSTELAEGACNMLDSYVAAIKQYGEDVNQMSFPPRALDDLAASLLLNMKLVEANPKLLAWYHEILTRLNGSFQMYLIKNATKKYIPFEVVKNLVEIYKVKIKS
jgi:hypothetical protein